MKSTIAMLAVGLAALGAANSASAFKLSPPSTKFTGTGPTSATLNGITLACTGTLTGATTATGIGHVTGGSFTGAVGCSSVTFSGTPWLQKAVSATQTSTFKVDFTTPLGSCGPATLKTTLTGGTYSYNGKFDQCSNIQLTLKTTPTVSIVP